jgi:hypothetical protein
VSQARASKGDYAFFDKLKIKDWQSMTPEQLQDRVGDRFVELSQGKYGAGGLPPYLLNSSDNQFIRSMFNLNRWGVERFNNWYKHAWRPAVDKGEFGPLLRGALGNLASASVLRWLEQEILGTKPAEMTWKEFLKADNKEVAYTLFSKLQVAGYAGILSSVAAGGTQLMNKELPLGVENTGWEALGNLVLRLGQFGSGISSGDIEPADAIGELAKTIMTDNIQVAKMVAAAGREDTGNREERLYKRQMGLNTFGGNANISNPFTAADDLRKATTIPEMEKALPAVGRAIAKTGNVPRLRTPMRQLYRDDQRPNFYEYLSTLQGQGAALKQFDRDVEQDQLTELKRAEVEALSQISSEPQY